MFGLSLEVGDNNVATIEGAGLLVGLYALLRDKGVKMVEVVAKGRQLTSGYVNPNGLPIQPTYEWVKVRVAKPPSKIVHRTAKKHAFSDETKPLVQYGVAYYKADDDGRRTYSFPNPEKPDNKQSRNASVFQNLTEGYYIINWQPDVVSHGMPNEYAGIGIKDWWIYRIDNRGYANDKDAAIAACDELFAQKLEPQPEPRPDDPPPFTPEQPDWGLGGGTIGAFSMNTQNQDDETPAEPPQATPPPTGGQPETPPMPPPTLEPNEPEPEEPTFPNEPQEPIVPTNPFDPSNPLGGNGGGEIGFGEGGGF